MSEPFFSSDPHFWHKRVLEFCPQTRPFTSVEEMNEGLITAWNNKVGKNDIVYHTGDFSFGKVEQTLEVLDRLNGEIHLVLGNHDGQFDNAQLRRKLAWCGNYKEIRSKVLGTHIVLFHFPIESWNRMLYGAVHCHGHLHSGINPPSHDEVRLIPRRMDIGIDSRLDYSPWSWEEIKKRLGV